MIELWLPYPPSANRIWRTAKGRTYRSAAYNAWFQEAAVACIENKITIAGPYKLSITAARPDRRRRDLDNIIKPIGDLLKYVGAIQDDSFCEMLSARWVTAGDGVAVRIEPAGVER